ncbi:MAG TPA: cytochrome c oxidase subunit II [Candidatus Bathyarchaeia archaeon]|nr:cytochrome c oxidase subunit II [Candidatus Bathyarchaeia archaeon]
MKSRWQLNWRLLSMVMALALVLTGCGRENLSTLIPKGPVAEQQLFLMVLTSAIMIGVFLIVMIIFAYVLIRYRQRPGQTGIPKQVEGNHKLEILWTVIPFLLLIVMAVPTVAIAFDLAKEYNNKEAVQVNVTAHQFWWEFEYPDLGVRTAQELVIPAGKKVQFHVTSADVIHAFWIPALGGKIDTNPGLTNKIWLEAKEPGIYYGKCAELCGASHALMDFKVEALEASAFDEWAKKMKAATEAPAATTATATAAQGQEIFKKSCIGCHAIGSEGGKLGPNLTNFGERKLVAGIKPNDAQHLADWLKNPQEMKPGNTMPNLNLDDTQVKALVEYLHTLKVNQ